MSGTPLERLDARVDRSGGPDACWPWMGARNEHGYGVLRVDGRNERTHRLALRREEPDPGPDIKVLHSCDNPPCCNPSHLRYGSQGDNIMDAIERGRRVYPERRPRPKSDPKPRRGKFSGIAHCVHGHPFDASNTIAKRNPAVRSGIERVCRTCRTRRDQEAAAVRKAIRHSRKAASNGE